MLAGVSPTIRALPRHSALVRVTHWITFICFVALLVTGVEIVISHPRFYWGETGNSSARPLFQIPIPSSRDTVPTGYKYVMPDQNGWSRYLHFQAAWAAVLTGVVYVVWGVWTRHFLNKTTILYNALQRATYLVVIFFLFPLVIWTGLALSPAFDSAVPAAVNLLGGRQSARTLHFFISGFLTLFVVVHVVMVIRAGFLSRMRAMITGFEGSPRGVQRNVRI
jgi:thiosulfate reductase cytochrome b subunit